MPNVKMGFEGKIYYGVAGATAATLLENVTDLAYNLDKEAGNTMVRGDSSVPPIDTEDVTARSVSIEWTMINDITDTALEALRVAAFLGTGVAIRTKDHSAGKGYDGDATLTCQNGKPLRGEQTLQFSAKPSRSYGRVPQLYV